MRTELLELLDAVEGHEKDIESWKGSGTSLASPDRELYDIAHSIRSKLEANEKGEALSGSADYPSYGGSE